MSTVYFQPPGIRPQYCEAGMISETDPDYIWYYEEPCKILISQVKIIPKENVIYNKKSRLYEVKQKRTMTKNEKILKIEAEVKEIFAKDNIRRLDVIKANRLIDEWTLLTNYKYNKTPILEKTSEQVLDDQPMWSKNLIINYE